jgi:DNA-binding NarL/FixJ family response regulator
MHEFHSVTKSFTPMRHVLPLEPDPPDPGPSSSESSGDGAEAARRRILIVEDETFAVLYIADVVSEGGYEVAGTSASARDAIAKAESERPDLVLMDIRLTGAQDGVHAATEINRRFGIRSIFVTAYTDPETRRRAAVANPIGFVEKPFSPETLLAAIRRAF